MLLRRRQRARPASEWVPEDPRGDPAYSRPDEWWERAAGRPRHLTERPGILVHGYGSPDTGRALDEYALEPVIWLAKHGHLTDAEVACIREAARDAAPRVGSDREEFSSPAVSRDRIKVRLAVAVDAALAGEPDDRPDYGVGRGRHVDAEYTGP